MKISSTGLRIMLLAFVPLFVCALAFLVHSSIGREPSKGYEMSTLGIVFALTAGGAWLMYKATDSREKQLRKEAARCEKITETIFNTSKESFVGIDEQFQVTLFNDAAERLFGYRSDEIVGRDIRQLIPNCDSKIQYSYTTTATTKSGESIPVNWYSGTALLDNEKIQLIIVQDISEEIKRNEEFETRTAEIENLNWLKSSITEVHEVTTGISDVSLLVNKILMRVGNQLDIAIGAFYLNTKLFDAYQNDEFILYGSYAFEQRKGSPKRFGSGEGLVGQCALEQKQMTISQVPSDYLHVASGLGDSAPNQITLLPIIHEGMVIGVLELGTMSEFTQLQKQYLKELADSIGIIIQGTVERSKIEDLSTEINNQIQAINRSNAAIEFDLEGNILTANDIFLDLMGYELSEIKGKHHRIFVEEEYARSEEYRNFWKTLLTGEFKNGEFERRNKQGEAVWIQGNYNPIYGRDGKAYKVLKLVSDITDQKEQQNKTEALAVELENRIQAINRSNAAIEFDLFGNILSANPIFVKLMGYPLEEIEGKHHRIFVSPEEAESEEYKQFWQDLHDGKIMSGEFQRVDKEGNAVWIHGSYNPILDKNGKPYKVLKMAVDITQQKLQQVKTQELSAEVNNQIQAINRSNAAIEFDLSGHILTANDRFLNLMGYSLEEVKGKHHSMFVDDDYAQSSAYQELWSALNRGEFKSGEFQRKNKNDEPIWIHGSYNPILNTSNEPYKVLKIAVDITQQKLTEIELREQKEELLQQEEELRQSNEELQAQTEKLKASEEELRMQQEELAQINAELEEKSEVLEANNRSILQKNQALEQTKQILDIKAQELESSSKFKSEFLANMSHELRTPLNSILILSELLRDNKAQNLTEKQREFASVINKSGSDLLKLINEVLDLVKVESGKIELEIEDYELGKFANEMEQTFMGIAKKKGIHFDVSLDRRLPHTIQTDGHRLAQVVKNLLSNAFKFTPPEGKVTLKFEKIRSKPGFKAETLLRAADVLRISVNDSGIGIAKENHKTVFEAFKQADGSTQRKFGGTGLGLSISKELTSMLGGEIELDSELGEGATFIIYLPFSARRVSIVADEIEEELEAIIESAEQEAEQIYPTDGFGGHRQKFEAVIADDRDTINKNDRSILIVEDDLEFARVLLDFARTKGFKGVVANQGDLALKYVAAYNPKAIILDMQLPVMDGWTVLKKLKSSPYCEIPVHVMTGMDKSELGIRMGAVEYLLKPIAPEMLENTFAEIKEACGSTIRNVLVVEDHQNQVKAIQSLIERENLSVTSANTGAEALEIIESAQLDTIILDLGLPDIDGLDLLEQIKHMSPDLPVLIFTGRELSKAEQDTISRYRETSVVLKAEDSYKRLLEETELFIHHIDHPTKNGNNKVAVAAMNGRSNSEIEVELRGKRILAVDDDMRNIYSLQMLLESEGVDIQVATNGQEAVDAIKEDQSIDAVLMDIMMPVMDGYEATRQIRGLGHKDLPIIALTAKAMKGDREKCLEAGVSDYMSKPINMEKLLSLLRVWLYQ